MRDDRYIPRHLSWIDKDHKPQRVSEDQLRGFTEPLVILGEPGMGKTFLMEKLGGQPGFRFVRAISFLREDDRPRTDRLVIDGLDEVAAVEEGDPLHNVLKKLAQCGKPTFILSCRSAEWRGVTAKTDIVDDYGATPLELTLERLTRDEALRFLKRTVSADKAQEALESLDEADLADMYKNPLLLGFVSAIVKADGAIPRTRAKLYAQAVKQLRSEHNPRLTNANLAKLSEEAALDAAGAAMATLLLTGKEAIVKNSGDADDRILTTGEVARLANVDDVNTVLGSNLLKSEGTGGGRVVPLHRTVAEYLGARWLARKIGNVNYQSRAVARLLALMSRDGGVPASLRGLHAWFPHFSPTLLGPRAIDSDPYGVLRYGDTDGLSVQQARHLLGALKDLSADDPYFRSDYWGRFSAKALVQSELRGEIRDILTDTDAAFQLRALLLECLVGSNLSKELHEDLLKIARDPKRAFHERATSVESLAKLTDKTLDWPALVQELIGLEDEDSHRLAVGTLTEVGVDRFDDALIASAIIVHSGVLSRKTDDDRHSLIRSFHSLSRQLPDRRIAGVLNSLAQGILPTRSIDEWWKNDHNWMARRAIASFAEELTDRQLGHDAEAVSSQRLWDWLRALANENGYQHDNWTAVGEFLKRHDELRRGVHRLALFEPGVTNKLERLFHLGRLNVGLQIQDADALTLLREIVARKDPSDQGVWRVLVNQFRTAKGVKEDVQIVARPYAEGNLDLIEFLTSNPKRTWEEEETKFRKQERERKKREENRRAVMRKDFSEHIDEVRAGAFRWIQNPARAYLNMFSDLNREAAPAERVSEWLGDDLRDAALEGFEAVLHKSDLPSAKQVAESYAESKVWNYIYPMLAGAGERMFRGKGFGDLSPDLVSALAIAAEQEPVDDQHALKGLSDVLGAVLRKSDELYEAHVRQRFEPHLRKKNKHIRGLYSFARSVDQRPLSIRLALEWLSKFADLPQETESELVECIVGAPREEYAAAWKSLTEIAQDRLSMNLGDPGRVEFWQSLQFLLDSDTAIRKIPLITHETRHWFWLIMAWFHDRLDRREYATVATVQQLKWIIDTFRSAWPVAERPGGVTSGSTNPWDATSGLRWAINQLARNPSEAAGAALTELREVPDAYTSDIQAAIAKQRRVRLEAHFQSPSLSDLEAALENTSPRSAADVQTIVCDELMKLQDRVHGDPLNIVNNFYSDQGKPRTENECRDQMLIALGSLPFRIQVLPETAMPQGNRSDVAFVFDNIIVPLEAKGQWHKDIWTAAVSQLDRFYSIHHQAATKGIYVVFWFGKDAPSGKRIKSPPEGILTPRTAQEMRTGLERLVPSYRRGDIAIVVLDLTRPGRPSTTKRKTSAKKSLK